MNMIQLNEKYPYKYRTVLYQFNRWCWIFYSLDFVIIFLYFPGVFLFVLSFMCIIHFFLPSLLSTFNSVTMVANYWLIHNFSSFTLILVNKFLIIILLFLSSCFLNLFYSKIKLLRIFLNLYFIMYHKKYSIFIFYFYFRV